jgi:hypothetical protein
MLQLCEEVGINRPFDLAYGAPRCAWAGGRPSVIAEELDDVHLNACFEAYAEHDVRIALTLSRLSVDESSYGDAYCHRILDAAVRWNAEIILFDDGLANYIHTTHPNLRLIASLNRSMCDFKQGFDGLEEDAYYRMLLERYDEVVIRCEFAMDDANLTRLADIADRAEIIVNQFCVPNCPNVYRHVSSMENWGGQAEIHTCYSKSCAANLRQRLANNLHFSNARINRFAELGFLKMKLAGRNAPIPSFLDMLSDYVFEPTGIIPFLRSELSSQFQRQTAARGGRLVPFTLPGSLPLL